MQITREADYAIRSILYLASQDGLTATVGDISDAQEIPKTFTAKILQKLTKAGLVRSIRGVTGGFTLAREPFRITLLDVIEAVQGPLALNICVVDKKSCNRIPHCSVHPVWLEINQAFKRRLSEYTFEKLINPPD
jgi:Rrf2 family protein